MSETFEQELYTASSRSVQVEVKGGKPLAAGVREREGQALRLIEEGRLGVASASGELSAAAGASLLERARAAARAGDAPGFVFAPPAPAPELPELFDPAVEALGPGELGRMAAEAVERLREQVPDGVVDLQLGTRVLRERLVCSSGLELQQEATDGFAAVSLSLTLGQDLVNVYADCGGRRPAGLLEQASRRAVEWLGAARRQSRISSGNHRVLFAPEAVGALLDAWVVALDGLELGLGTSPFASRLGDAVADGRLSLSEDGRDIEGMAASRWDGEGVPRQPVELVAGGVLRGGIHSLKSAALAGAASTGSSVRCELLPMLQPGNWKLASSETRPWSELLRELGEGLLVVELLGIGQTAGRDGAFSNPLALGFRVEGGELAGRVTDAMISGNAFAMLAEQLLAAGDDPLWTYRLGFPLRTPSLLFDRVAVTAAG